MKPRSDSKLKCLPEERQEQIYAWSRMRKTDDCPGGLQHAREQLAADGVKVSLTTISEFVAWYELRQRFALADSRSAQAVELLREKDPTISPEKLREFGQMLFTAESMAQGDAKTFVALERLDLDRKTAKSRGEIEREKLKIANRRVKLLEEREAKIKATLENKQLSGEQQAERIREIFKRP